MKVRDVIFILEANGFAEARQNASHRVFRGEVAGRLRLVVVAGHLSDDIPRGTLGSIKRQACLPRHA